MMPRAPLLRFTPQKHQQEGGGPSCSAIQICVRNSESAKQKQKQLSLCREAKPNPGSIIKLVVNNIMVRPLTCATHPGHFGGHAVLCWTTYSRPCRHTGTQSLSLVQG